MTKDPTDLDHSQSSPIGRRLMLYVLIFSTCVTLATTVVQIYSHYEHELKEIENQFSQIERGYLSSLTSVLWQLNNQTLNIIVDGIVRLPDITHLVIVHDGNIIATAGTSTDANSIVREFNLKHETDTGTLDLGVLRVSATLERAYSQVAAEFWVALANNGIVIFSVAIFVFFLFNKLVTQHLIQIATYARQLDPQRNQSPLELDRSDKSRRSHDELGDVANAINTMRVNLVDGYQALARSEARTKDFAEASSDWLWEMDKNLVFTYVSDRFYKISGLSHDKFIGRQHDLMAELEPLSQEWQSHIKDLKWRRPFRDFTYSETLADGTKGWYRLSGRPVFSGDGDFLGYRGTGTDITGEVRAREEAVETTQRFLDAIENVSDGIAFWDDQNRFVLCNRRFRNQAGAATHILVRGAHYEDYIREVLKHQNLDLTEEEQDAWVQERLQEHHDAPSPVEVFRDGSWLLTRRSASPDGSSVSVTTDITELKQREEELQSITNAVPILISYVDKELRYRMVNKTFEEWSGMTRESIIGQRVRDIWGEQIERRNLQYSKLALSGKPTRFEELSVPYPDPESAPRHAAERQAETTYTPDFNDSGEVIGYFIAATDITERKLAEAELQQSHKMEAVGQLTGGIAHDFNNLLAVIVGSLNILQNDDNSEKSARMIAAALRSARRGAELTQRLLAFGRRQSLVAMVTDVNDLISGLTELMRRTLGISVQINTSLGHDLWKMNVDRGQLENSLLNLAINARDAMPDGGQLTIETSNVVLDSRYTDQHEGLTPGTYGMIAVSDTGNGMSPEVLNHAIEPFYTTKEVGAGSGLGLSMVYGFTRQSGGHMGIYSEEGKGCVVRLYIPTADDEESLPEISPEPPSGQKGQGERILVIEDDPDVRATTVGMLLDLGYKVVETGTGAEALGEIDGGSEFDLVFTDVFLAGGMNGPDVAKEIKIRNPDIPILFTSGYSANQISGDGTLEETVHLISKPFELSQLAIKLRETIDEGRNSVSR